MERYYVGLDVSKEKTAICVRRSDGSMDKACETRTDPDAIFAALAPFRDGLERVILETGRMAPRHKGGSPFLETTSVAGRPRSQTP